MLRDWSEPARKGVYLEDQKVNSQELDFWGGDLHSLSTRIGYVAELGADALYLNPIHLGYTNHKYDALDFMEISPEYGTRSDFRRLAEQVHGHGMKLLLDGVFNHMGRNSPRFRDAFSNPESPWRNWFYIDPQYADGWRLDTAYELGRPFLSMLTASAHAEKPNSEIIGEIVNYPGEWLQSMDGVMSFTLRKLIYSLVREEVSPALAARSFVMLQPTVPDLGGYNRYKRVP